MKYFALLALACTACLHAEDSKKSKKEDAYDVVREETIGNFKVTAKAKNPDYGSQLKAEWDRKQKEREAKEKKDTRSKKKDEKKEKEEEDDSSDVSLNISWSPKGYTSSREIDSQMKVGR